MARSERVELREAVPVEQLGEMDRIFAVHGRIPAPLSVLLYSPGLALRVMEAGTHLRGQCTLAASIRELAILALASERECAYVWEAHLPVALAAGLDEVWIEVLQSGGEGPLTEIEGSVVSYVRQLASTNRVESALFDRLRDENGERWMVELTAIVGHYEYMCAVLNAFAVVP